MNTHRRRIAKWRRRWGGVRRSAYLRHGAEGLLTAISTEIDMLEKQGILQALSEVQARTTVLLQEMKELT
jgi:hypothetical protein